MALSQVVRISAIFCCSFKGGIIIGIDFKSLSPILCLVLPVLRFMAIFLNFL
jgi:hypothetical protein